MALPPDLFLAGFQEPAICPRAFGQVQGTGQPRHQFSQAERNYPNKHMPRKQQAERLPEAVRCNAQRSALRRPMQHAAMANAARCEKRSNEMRQVTQPILLISHTGKEARGQAKGLMPVGSISPECIGIRSCKQ
mgnify:CR=1 FL=1